MMNDNAIRPFRVEFPADAVDDLRRRINATLWPTRELRSAFRPLR